MLAEECDWKLQAACRYHGDAELWFPQVTDRYSIVNAKKICFECPVRRECLNAGIREEHGIWGGLTAEQRHQIRKSKFQVLK